VASELHIPVGTVPGYGSDIEVCRHPDGSAAISVEFGVAVSVPPESVAALAELLGRAAMPGQVSGKHGNHGPGCGCTPCLAEPGYRQVSG
jgi:hypothetical protein